MKRINGNYREIKLDNGLIVALQKTPTKTVGSVLRVHQGAFHEREDERGLSHFLEHCVVRGGTEMYSPKEIEGMLDCLGDFNAHTSLGMTYFYAEMLGEDLKEWLKVISQIAFYPRFDEKMVDEERQRVLREIEEKETGNDYRAKAMLMNAVFRNHPANTKIHADKSIVQKAGTKQLGDLHRRGYNAGNSDLILVGDLPDDVEGMVKQYFGNVIGGINLKPRLPALNPLEKKAILEGPPLNREDNKTEILLATVTIPISHPDNYALRVLYSILCTAPNSRLFARLSSREGLTYSVSGNYESDNNANNCLIQTIVSEDKVDKTIGCIFDEIDSLRNEKIDEGEIEKIKRNIRFKVASTLDTNQGHINAMYHKWKFGQTVDDLLKCYDAVTREDLVRVAQEHLPVSREDGKYVLMIRKSK